MLATKTLIIKILLVSFLYQGLAHACDLNLSNSVGPWDYYDSINNVRNGENPMGNIKRVTNVHLTPGMLRLEKRASGTFSGDIDYTLRAIPNHPAGLDLASRLEKRLSQPGAELTNLLKYERPKHTAECYFKRAIALAPNRSYTYVVYGIHLHRFGKYEDASKAYAQALALGSDTIETNYNYGLSLVKSGRFAEAEQQAKIAYQGGFPLPGLRNMLQQQGYCKSECIKQ
jgi:tetratricopeptide (TPR) repeat protein